MCCAGSPTACRRDSALDQRYAGNGCRSFPFDSHNGQLLNRTADGEGLAVEIISDLFAKSWIRGIAEGNVWDIWNVQAQIIRQ